MLLALVVASLLLSGCAPGAPQPTPDPFQGLRLQSEEELKKGLDALERGEFREALTALERARVLNPEQDERIETAIERARAALNPTPTPTITLTPTITPTPRPPVRLSTQQPDEGLAESYFGITYLTVIPGRIERLDPLTGRSVVELPAPMTVFWTEYQIGLFIEKLGLTLRQPFTLRIFDVTTQQLVAEASAETPLTAPTAAPPGARAAPSATPLATPTPVGPGTTTPGPTPVASGALPIKRWFDRFVWYKEGGEAPGRYRLELYAGAQLARVLDYEVRAEFVPLPTQTPTPEPTGTPTPSPTPTPVGTPEPPPGAPEAPGAPAAPPTPAATPTATATPTPTPAVAAVAVTGGLPAAITFNAAGSHLYVADASGVIWMVDHNGPSLRQPFVLEASPMDAVMDPLTGRLYVSLKGTGGQTAIAILNGSTGERLSTITVPNGQVTDLTINPGIGMLYALVPSSEQLTVVDLRNNSIRQSIKFGPLGHVTGAALEPSGRRLFMSTLAGELLIFEGADPRNVQQVRISGSGLAGIAADDNRVFAINTPGKKVYVVDPTARRVLREIALDQEPGAIAAGADDRMVYVLGTQRPAIIRIDPERGEINGLAFLPARSGLMNITPGGARDLASQRAQLAINPFDGSIYVTQPELGTVSVVTPDKFPSLEGRGP